MDVTVIANSHQILLTQQARSAFLSPVPQHSAVTFAEKNARRSSGKASAESRKHRIAAQAARRQRAHGAFGSTPAHRFNWLACGTTASLREERSHQPDEDEDPVEYRQAAIDAQKRAVERHNARVAAKAAAA